MSFLFPADEPKKPRASATSANTTFSLGARGSSIDVLVFEANNVDLNLVTVAVDSPAAQGFDRSEISTDLIAAQCAASGAEVAKIGMVPSSEAMELVAAALLAHDIVACPSLYSKAGFAFSSKAAVTSWKTYLLPAAAVSFLNHIEASALLDRTVESPTQMKDAVKALVDLGARHPVVTGGHLDGIVRDFCHDGSGVIEFGADQIRTEKIVGAGCALSAFVAARIAHGDDVLEAVEHGRAWISAAIQNARPLRGWHIVETMVET